MPIFIYTAVDARGQEQKGKKEAANKEEVQNFLKNKGLSPTSIKNTEESQNKKKAKTAQKGGGLNISLGPAVMKTKEITLFTRQMAILLDAGLPLIRSLKTLARQAKNPVVRKIIDETATAVEGGATFSEALAQHPASFDKLFLNMVRAGEAAGKIELILNRLAMFMEKAAKIKGKVKSAMVYPVVVLCIAGGITAGLMIFIVPKFAKIFTDLLEGAPMPAITQVVLAMSDFMVNNILMFLGGIVALVIIIKLILKVPFLRYYIDWAKYNMPIFGLVVSRSSISRFARTLGTLMGSGVAVLNALIIVKETSGNEVVSEAVVKVYEAVKEGEPMAPPLSATKIFPEMVISMIEVGEETGKLPEMLEKVADTYDEEVDNAVAAMTSMIEPLMIIFLAVIVGGLVIALFAPLITIIEKLGT